MSWYHCTVLTSENSRKNELPNFHHIMVWRFSNAAGGMATKHQMYKCFQIYKTLLIACTFGESIQYSAALQVTLHASKAVRTVDAQETKHSSSAKEGLPSSFPVWYVTTGWPAEGGRVTEGLSSIHCVLSNKTIIT